ncbi:DUF302 domain-containing protein [Dechloromonas sp. HYN0024]|uniref:DUF302 domain-containing protein n=1 Tax=Dechloromonas sp. HYN0024 TaxID=2231055 RepID=UPI000E42EA61|nr:DUF302 domain-containing protein [Dechloromonas sp. HYN0024]AXS79279.1 DUF302 domain-containing protein [Dechloromonas sp. HYN0024]
MFYIVDSDKSFYEATTDLVPVIQRLGLNVLHIHDLGGMLDSRDIEFDDECQVFEVGNPRLVEKVLAIDRRLSLALPWRISVYTEDGITKIALARPGPVLAALSSAVGVERLAHELEEKLIQVVDETR